MLQLDLTVHRTQLRIKHTEDGVRVFSPSRKAWLRLTKEEFVRQLLVIHLLQMGFAPGRISEEREISVFGMSRRYDLVIFDKQARPWMLVECKEPGVAIDQKTFDQIARYNIRLKVPYLLVTNGRQSYCCKIDYEAESYAFIDALPEAD